MADLPKTGFDLRAPAQQTRCLGFLTCLPHASLVAHASHLAFLSGIACRTLGSSSICSWRLGRPYVFERTCCEVVLMVAETWVVPLIFNILQFNEEDWSFWSSGAEDVA